MCNLNGLLTSPTPTRVQELPAAAAAWYKRENLSDLHSAADQISAAHYLSPGDVEYTQGT